MNALVPTGVRRSQYSEIQNIIGASEGLNGRRRYVTFTIFFKRWCT